MSTEHKDYDTPFGVIHYGPETCTDDYDNMEIYEQPPGGSPIILQTAALLAFREAEKLYGVRTDRPIHDRPILLTPGSNRSCETQVRLFAEDPKRYAHPDTTGHTRGIAIDVSTLQPNQDIIKGCLRKFGWTQARDDEPWHWSFGVTV